MFLATGASQRGVGDEGERSGPGEYTVPMELRLPGENVLGGNRVHRLVVSKALTILVFVSIKPNGDPTI
ncbi:hypothetical protein NHX12_012495 [Muraenolepis orangiensis]|uniref:Uncharacterized protein n=1 Tax=Muraenolepis orangiensis TaxID=630683 RepID=A0A9Q0DCU5_9TELE|nr:hypothetical protein NHX12_012495 [Muraenolepis orangiensis]